MLRLPKGTCSRLLLNQAQNNPKGRGDMTDAIRLVEVGPRDGLQNEPSIVSTENKVRLIQHLADAGMKTIEAGAFVSPKWVPKMADSAEVFSAIQKRPGVSYPMLTPNLKGFTLARDLGVEEVAIFGAASESFSQANINCSIDVSLDQFEAVCAAAHASGIRVRGYISCVLGCPYEGDVAPKAVVAVAQRLVSMGCYEVSLGDTIGTGTPEMTRRLIEDIAALIPVDRVAGHFHDTYGQAVANCWAAFSAGVRTFDASIAGLGGCPYAKGATGNVATEDLVYSFQKSGIQTGVDLERLLDAVQFASNCVGRPPVSRCGVAFLAKREASEKSA